MAARDRQVYATLLLNDAYLPGALVLAHSLRDAGTTKKLACLVTLDTVSAEVITQLKAVYDHVIAIPRIQNGRPANLYLMDRPDLHSTFTKINLWKQTQFSKIVYIDADVVAYRAPDELFDLAAPFAAAPDIGWPDLFNTGVMVLTPDMGDYYAMMAMAERGISFDGADQGLLNMYFKDKYHRLSFTYNVTPSAHYQYIPAYRHFQSSINMVHFIGPNKPWSKGRHTSSGESPYDEMVGRWWAVYDKHYRAQETTTPAPTEPAPELVQYFVKGEFQPKEAPPPLSTGEHHREHSVAPENVPAFVSNYERSQHPPVVYDPIPPHQQQHHHHPHFHQLHQHQHQEHREYHEHQDEHQHHQPPHHEYQQPYHEPYQEPPHHHHYHQHEERWHEGQPHLPPPSGDRPQSPEQPNPPSRESFSHSTGTQAEAREDQVPEQHERGPPPPSVEQRHERPPSPVKSWDAQRYSPPPDSKPEALNFPQQIYEMSRDPAPFVPPERYPSPPKNMWYEVPKAPPSAPSEKPRAIFPWEGHQPRATRRFVDEEKVPQEVEAPSEPESSTTEQKSEPATPTTPSIKAMPSDPWTTFTRTNAWDEVPEIERYVEGLQRHRRGKSHMLAGVSGGVRTGEGADGTWTYRSMKLTDFPSEVERPSLPVTPAPVRRPKFWGGGGPGIADPDDDELLPAAEGVPTQSDWDPVAQLQKLAKQQSDALLRRLGRDEGETSSELPTRSLPFGSEGAASGNTYVAHSSGGVVLSPRPVKGDTTSLVRSMGEREASAIPRSAGGGGGGGQVPVAIAEPAYTGPGVAWEKDENIATAETAALPTEEEMDVLDT